jgi:hypothetical protein
MKMVAHRGTAVAITGLQLLRTPVASGQMARAAFRSQHTHILGVIQNVVFLTHRALMLLAKNKIDHERKEEKWIT